MPLVLPSPLPVPPPVPPPVPRLSTLFFSAFTSTPLKLAPLISAPFTLPPLRLTPPILPSAKLIPLILPTLVITPLAAKSTPPIAAVAAVMFAVCIPSAVKLVTPSSVVTSLPLSLVRLIPSVSVLVPLPGPLFSIVVTRSCRSLIFTPPTLKPSVALPLIATPFRLSAVTDPVTRLV